MGNTKDSHELFEKSSALLDSLVATAPTPMVERELLEQVEQIYSGYSASLCRQGDLAGAFRTIERARGRIEARALEDHRASCRRMNLLRGRKRSMS